jgi:signal peptidase
MKSNTRLVVILGLLSAVMVFSLFRAESRGQEAVPLPPPATDTVAPDIPGVVKGGSKVHVVADGMKHTDGPAAMPDGTLLYWDYMERRIGKVDPQGKHSTFLTNTDGQSAIAFDSKGRLITTLKEHPPENKVGAIWPKGKEAIIADKFEGKNFEGPNDLVVDKKDGVYFTLSGSGTVLYARPGGGVIKVFAHPTERINGITLSPDEKTLYVAESETREIWAYRVDGATLAAPRLIRKFSDFSLDGIRTDIDGRLYVARILKGTIELLAPDGKTIREIALRASEPTNLAFGGPDGRTVYVTQRKGGFIETFRVNRPGREFCLQREVGDPACR